MILFLTFILDQVQEIVADFRSVLIVIEARSDENLFSVFSLLKIVHPFQGIALRNLEEKDELPVIVFAKSEPVLIFCGIRKAFHIQKR